jgi:hypothetical protein
LMWPVPRKTATDRHPFQGWIYIFDDVCAYIIIIIIKMDWLRCITWNKRMPAYWRHASAWLLQSICFSSIASHIVRLVVQYLCRTVNLAEHMKGTYQRHSLTANVNIVSKVLRCVAAGVKPALIGSPAGGESEIARCALLTAHYRMSCFEDINRSEVGRDIGPESKRFACFLYQTRISLQKQWVWHLYLLRKCMMLSVYLHLDSRTRLSKRVRFYRFKNKNDANATVSEMTVLQLLKFYFASASGTVWSIWSPVSSLLQSFTDSPRLLQISFSFIIYGLR